MSHAVKIDYKGISLQCQSICKLASSQLCKLDKMLNAIESGSKSLLNSQTESLRREIAKSKKALQDKIDSVVNKAKANAAYGNVIVDSDFMGKHADADRVITEAEELEAMVENLAESKLMEMESLLNSLMNGQLASHQEKLRDLALGKTHINLDIQNKINSMPDEIMRQYVYIAWVDNPEADFEEICQKAEQIKSRSDAQHFEQIEQKKLNEIREELNAANIDKSTIEEIVNQQDKSAEVRLRNARKQANEELINEGVRRESVKIIVQAIKKRGFILDSSAIRIDKAKNQVNIIAQKPDGAKAEFKVYLDGKFEYRFDGYEGQACQMDIQPFLDDLEKIYGMKIVRKTEIWRNPDKTSTMHYQTMNYNTNKG